MPLAGFQVKALPKKPFSLFKRQPSEEEIMAGEGNVSRMKGSVERSIEIDASPEEVFKIASTFEDYPVCTPSNPLYHPL